MIYYPMMANLTRKRCVVVGGGTVAERKIKSLIRACAEVIVISPRFTDQIKKWQEEGFISLFHRPFKKEDLEGAVLVIAATNQASVNYQVYEAIQPNQWINIVDRPDLCSFIVPALVERGDIQIAVSTGGQNPGLTKKLKKQIAEWLGPEYEEYVRFLGQMRNVVLSLPLPQKRKEALLQELLDDRFLEWTREGKMEWRAKEAQRLFAAYFKE